MDESAPSKRLAPQPAQLLQMLVDQYPEIVSRETIQQHLWPGVRSDFDKNLHFCVRQIRSAFDESASSPSYVETIPRRGYRLIADVEAMGKVEQSAETEREAAKKNRMAQVDSGQPNEHLASPVRGPFKLVIPACLVLLFLVVAFAVWKANWPAQETVQDTESDARTRIAIMPFRSEENDIGDLGNGDIALFLLQLLSTSMQRLDVIGPTTTQNVLTQHETLQDFAKSSRLDFIVNGKVIANSDRKGLLVEVIRAHDGSHVWVKAFGKEESNQEIAKETHQAILRQIADFEKAGREADQPMAGEQP